MSGTLDGLTIIEIGGIGPAPFCGMMLADHGAEVVLVHRLGAAQRLAEQRVVVGNQQGGHGGAVHRKEKG